ncbi:MAG: hypothetical protein QM655_16620 [Nocardioidaceae bacterium]
MSALLGAVLATLVGIGSGLVPIFNAETCAVVSVGTHPWAVLPAVVALAAGQTVAKVVLFEGARRGSQRARAGSRLHNLANSRWATRTLTAMRRKRTAIPLILASASAGLPPLALVSVAAGALGQRRRTFAVLCFLGRTARFATIALPIAYIAGPH